VHNQTRQELGKRKRKKGRTAPYLPLADQKWTGLQTQELEFHWQQIMFSIGFVSKSLQVETDSKTGTDLGLAIARSMRGKTPLTIQKTLIMNYHDRAGYFG
jgi:hypothetical protein